MSAAPSSWSDVPLVPAAYASGEFPARGDLVSQADDTSWLVLEHVGEEVVIFPPELLDRVRVVRPEALRLVERAP